MSFSPHIATVGVYDVYLVPWSATEIGTGRVASSNRKFRFVKKNPKLQTFQDTVALFARAAMAGKQAHDGPCYLETVFRRKTDDKDLHGKLCYVPLGGATNIRGDLTNYIKAVEDALEGVVYVKDQLVCAGRQMILWAARESVVATVYKLDDALFTCLGIHPEPWLSLPLTSVPLASVPLASVPPATEPRSVAEPTPQLPKVTTNAKKARPPSRPIRVRRS